MTARLPPRALAPAILAGLFGAAAHMIGSAPALTIAAAVLGAALGAVLIPDADAATETPPPTPPEPMPAADVDALIEALPLGILIVAGDRTVRSANAEALAHFGAQAAPGLPVANLRARKLLDGIDAALGEGVESAVDFSVPRVGEAHLRAHVRPIGSTGEILVAIADETEARRARESHRDFVANASHELKTPLAAISGAIETLLGHARDDPRAAERFLRMLSGQTERMTRLIEDLLSLNRVELNERVAPETPEDLIAAVAEAVDALRPAAEAAGVALDFVSPTSGIVVKADRDELDQLFRNLIDNAIKYGGRGAAVTVGCRTDAPDGPGIAGICVRDDGPGVAREHVPRLTERFYRVNVGHSRERGGTGLGLAICKHVANRHRGRLEIESRPDEGSRFTVWLPVHARTDSPPSRRRDDDPANRIAPPIEAKRPSLPAT